MNNHFWQTIKNQMRGTYLYVVCITLYLWMMVGLFPTIQQKFVLIQQYVDSFPKGFMEFFSGGQTAPMNTLEGFLSLEFLSLIFVLILAFHVAGAAGAAIAGAIETRTMDFTLSQPITRTKLVLAELFATAVSSAVIVWLTTGALWFLARAYDITLSDKGLVAFGVVATIFIWCWLGIALLISSGLKTKMSVVGATLGLLVVTYTVTALSGLSDKLAKIPKYSLFHYYQPPELLKTGVIHPKEVAVLLVVGLVAAGLGIWLFNRRDV